MDASCDADPAVPRFLLLTDASGDAPGVARALSSAGTVERAALGAPAYRDRRPYRLFVDIDLRSAASVALYREHVRAAGLAGVPKVFLVNADDYQGDKQALALGADRLLRRPARAQDILGSLRVDMATDFKGALDGFARTRLAVGVRAAHDVLEAIFEDLPRGGLLNVRDLAEAEDVMASSLLDEGLSEWLGAVKTHHSSSYRHSLLVAGTATCFAQHIGASKDDQRRVARAALVHDVGKAFTPLSTLDKPGALTHAEEAEIRLHPEHGARLLRRTPGFSADTIDAVLHHHEYLDGSGYPHGLAGRDIPDLTRMITIADIFSALIEDRAYKPAYTHAQALDVMAGMGGKLDRDMMRVFEAMIAGEARCAAPGRRAFASRLAAVG
jgi:putative nucleotidyltransferase with HDIG domain